MDLVGSILEAVQLDSALVSGIVECPSCPIHQAVPYSAVVDHLLIAMEILC